MTKEGLKSQDMESQGLGLKKKNDQPMNKGMQWKDDPQIKKGIQGGEEDLGVQRLEPKETLGKTQQQQNL